MQCFQLYSYVVLEMSSGSSAGDDRYNIVEMVVH